MPQNQSKNNKLNKLDKPQLRGEYIAPVSGHSRGATVDLTVLQCDADGNDCAPMDMGTAFDFFGTRANTDSPLVTWHPFNAPVATDGGSFTVTIDADGLVRVA